MSWCIQLDCLWAHTLAIPNGRRLASHQRTYGFQWSPAIRANVSSILDTRLCAKHHLRQSPMQSNTKQTGSTQFPFIGLACKRDFYYDFSTTAANEAQVISIELFANNVSNACGAHSVQSHAVFLITEKRNGAAECHGPWPLIERLDNFYGANCESYFDCCASRAVK